MLLFIIYHLAATIKLGEATNVLSGILVLGPLLPCWLTLQGEVGRTSGRATLNTVFNSKGEKKPSKVFSNLGMKGNFLVNSIINAPHVTAAHCYSGMPGCISD